MTIVHTHFTTTTTTTNMYKRVKTKQKKLLYTNCKVSKF